MKDAKRIDMTTVQPTTSLPTTASTHADDHKLADFKLNQRQQFLRGMMHTVCHVHPAFGVRIGGFFFLRPRRKGGDYTAQLPQGAESLTLQHGNEALRAYAWGSGERTILLVHGWESHIGRMVPLVEPLLAAGFRVVALDGPGHGQSTGLLTNMWHYGEAVRDVIAQLPSLHGIVAHSFGGAATTLMFARYPHVRVPKLALLAPMHHIDQHLDIFIRLTGFPQHHIPRLQHYVAQRIGRPLAACDVLRAAQTLHFPALIVHDRDDTVIPFGTSDRLAQLWKGASFVETQMLGHRGVLQSAQVHSRVCEYLYADA